jgi:hypothetical protein
MRQEAYGWVQRCAIRAGGMDFKAALKSDADVARFLDAAHIDRLCSLEAQLQHVDTIFARVLA